MVMTFSQFVERKEMYLQYLNKIAKSLVLALTLLLVSSSYFEAKAVGEAEDEEHEGQIVRVSKYIMPVVQGLIAGPGERKIYAKYFSSGGVAEILSYRTPLHIARFALMGDELEKRKNNSPEWLYYWQLFHSLLNHGVIPGLLSGKLVSHDAGVIKQIGVPSFVCLSNAVKGLGSEDCLILRALQGRNLSDIIELRSWNISAQTRQLIAGSSLTLAMLAGIAKAQILMGMTDHIADSLGAPLPARYLINYGIFTASFISTTLLDSDKLARFLYKAVNNPALMTVAMVQSFFYAVIYLDYSNLGLQSGSRVASSLFVFEWVSEALSATRYDYILKATGRVVASLGRVVDTLTEGVINFFWRAEED